MSRVTEQTAAALPCRDQPLLLPELLLSTGKGTKNVCPPGPHPRCRGRPWPGRMPPARETKQHRHQGGRLRLAKAAEQQQAGPRCVWPQPCSAHNCQSGSSPEQVSAQPSPCPPPQPALSGSPPRPRPVAPPCVSDSRAHSRDGVVGCTPASPFQSSQAPPPPKAPTHHTTQPPHPLPHPAPTPTHLADGAVHDKDDMVWLHCRRYLAHLLKQRLLLWGGGWQCCRSRGGGRALNVWGGGEHLLKQRAASWGGVRGGRTVVVVVDLVRVLPVEGWGPRAAQQRGAARTAAAAPAPAGPAPPPHLPSTQPCGTQMQQPHSPACAAPRCAPTSM